MNISEDFIKKIKGNPQNISLIKMMKIEEMLMKNTKKNSPQRGQMNLGEEHFNKWIPALFRRSAS